MPTYVWPQAAVLLSRILVMATEQSIIVVLEEDPSLRQMIRTCL